MDYNSELAYFKKKNRKLIFVLILIILALTASLIAYYKYTQGYKSRLLELETKIDDMVAPYDRASKEVSINLLQSQICDIGELATVEYLYTDAGKFENPKKLLGVNVPLTTKSFIAKWDGIIKAGVKVDEITIETDDSNKEIVIYIPKATILSHEIMDDSIETLDQKDGLFNPVKVEDVRTFDSISKESMEKRAIENGLLDKAYKNAKQIIKKLVNNEAIKNLGYHITFETP